MNSGWLPRSIISDIGPHCPKLKTTGTVCFSLYESGMIEYRCSNTNLVNYPLWLFIEPFKSELVPDVLSNIIPKHKPNLFTFDINDHNPYIFEEISS